MYQKKKNYAISLNIPLLKNITSTKAVIELENNVSTVDHPVIFSSVRREENVRIRHSHFRNYVSAYGIQWINKES